MNWLQQQTTLYAHSRDVTGVPRTLRQVLLCDFNRDINALCALHKLDRNADDYKERKNALKATLQGYTPAALMQSRAKDNIIVTSRTGLMQLDFDHAGIRDYDIEELKQAVFSLPFIAFCGLSCSGDGFYALALVAEPERLADYAQHCFTIFTNDYGIAPDTTKGSKAQDLRYVSYDADMLIRENPKPLQVNHFRRKQQPKQTVASKQQQPVTMSSNGLLCAQLQLLRGAEHGSLIPTIQRVAYTLGGMGDSTALEAIKAVISSSPQYATGIEKALKCADDCFSAGKKNPLNN